MGQLTDPTLIELSADATWPAQTSEPLGPWRLRATHGYSHRANSVRTVCADRRTSAGGSWEELIQQAETFYRQQHLPAIFHISPATVPHDLDQILTRRGYGVENVAEVWSGNPGEVREATAYREVFDEIVMRDEPDAAWLRCAVDEHIGPLKIREEICRRVPPPRLFASMVEKNEPVARGLGAVHGGIGWVYCMATVADHQRRGYARWILNRLADWSKTNGAHSLCLQVLASNVAARSLYSGATFRKQYDYHYRVSAGGVLI
ncbi:MAG TPA: GNAT family N-acetyltransferase [Tepidisphaeraceae bacterium]|jgi:GNAT superfamily N-acetyltransferase|nr:GNAT family N-acetyltransferase [Tepidisphaeraceae bacterium]